MKSTRIAALALAMTGVVCILLGCGNPTTANYIIMVTVAAPTLVLLGVEPLVAHFFVFLVPAGRAADDRARADATLAGVLLAAPMLARQFVWHRRSAVLASP